MKANGIILKGFFESQPAETGEEVLLAVPENDLERDMLSWAILAHGETVQEDSARRGYTFRYELGTYLRDGLFALRVACRDASGVEHVAEIAAGLAVVAPAESGRTAGFLPLWVMSRRIHFRPLKGETHEQYHRPAFGHLLFGGSDNLPHRRLFGALVR